MEYKWGNNKQCDSKSHEENCRPSFFQKILGSNEKQLFFFFNLVKEWHMKSLCVFECVGVWLYWIIKLFKEIHIAMWRKIVLYIKSGFYAFRFSYNHKYYFVNSNFYNHIQLNILFYFQKTQESCRFIHRLHSHLFSDRLRIFIVRITIRPPILHFPPLQYLNPTKYIPWSGTKTTKSFFGKYRNTTRVLIH